MIVSCRSTAGFACWEWGTRCLNVLETITVGLDKPQFLISGLVVLHKLVGDRIFCPSLFNDSVWALFVEAVKLLCRKPEKISFWRDSFRSAKNQASSVLSVRMSDCEEGRPRKKRKTSTSISPAAASERPSSASLLTGGERRRYAAKRFFSAQAVERLSAWFLERMLTVFFVF